MVTPLEDLLPSSTCLHDILVLLSVVILFLMRCISISVVTKVGAWRDRIIICTGTYGPTPALIKAFIDSGAKAVICSSAEPQEMQLTTFHGSGDYNALENGKFEIGEEEVEEEEAEPASPRSDWEDSEPERSGDRSTGLWDDDEEELSQFVCELYDSLFREGESVDVALQRALASHRKLRYSCHLPTIP